MCGVFKLNIVIPLQANSYRECRVSGWVGGRYTVILELDVESHQGSFQAYMKQS